jgi:hypothetical protein
VTNDHPRKSLKEETSTTSHLQSHLHNNLKDRRASEVMTEEEKNIIERKMIGIGQKIIQEMNTKVINEIGNATILETETEAALTIATEVTLEADIQAKDTGTNRDSEVDLEEGAGIEDMMTRTGNTGKAQAEGVTTTTTIMTTTGDQAGKEMLRHVDSSTKGKET